MDEHELRRKRLRAFAPSQLARHQNFNLNSSRHDDPRSSAHAGVTPNGSYGHPTHTPEMPSLPLSTMPTQASSHLRTFRGSDSSMLTSPAPKKINTNVVDLTGDSDASGDDEDLARQLQAQYDAENSQPQSYSYPTASPSNRSVSRRTTKANQAISDDERVARELQAELDGGSFASTDDLMAESSHSRNNLNSRQNLANEGDDDAAYARQLQAEFDQERISASATSAHAVAEPSRIQEQLPAPALLVPHASRLLLRSFGEATRHIACAACGKPSLSSENELLLRFKQWSEKAVRSTAHISSVLVCSAPSCSAESCLGCGKLSNKASQKHTIKLESGDVVSWCCARGRTVLVWILLCGFDRRRTVERRREGYFKKPTTTPSNASSGTGVGYGSGYTFHAPPMAAQPVAFGKYGTYNPPGRYAQSVAAPAPAPAEAAEDDITRRLMVCLNSLLPSLEAESVQDFDMEPPVALAAILTQSNVLGTIAALLRHDSLEYATERMALYSKTLDVVHTLGSHYATANPAIHDTRRVQDGGPDILSISFASHDNDPKFEETQSLAACLRNFDKQSKNMLTNAKAHPQAFTAPDSKQMLSLCQRVSDLADFLLANATPAPAQGQAVPTNDDWLSDLAVLELPDNDIMSRHSYANDAARVQNQAPNRMKCLSLQIANLMTSLPPGIFIRHCASRLDVMKILIIGPKGTPYESGLFEFDLFCPSNFPNSPPSMKFRTTGAGQVRFNPNLYNDGKVCLSLLGTWSGEPWQAGKSTILQVLVSIQAMNFCDEPWYNEPGTSSDRSASLRYNLGLQGYTVQHAMLDWLRPQADLSVWGDIVQRHFAANAQAIQATVGGWAIDRETKMRLTHAMRRWEGGRRL
ncbi:hypothetical protein LTR36_005794 [Oleoguttula mirabilis]|uniref:UBC core domain-containing protein n=1 Tax=Oleoguttula mirabilis TaxID=1507867 RepID=A0AAV9JDL1_9PEZI|nr:hypothetical protein LTR36_005794 [Oleoguttula mirabilis]